MNRQQQLEQALRNRERYLANHGEQDLIEKVEEADILVDMGPFGEPLPEDCPGGFGNWDPGHITCLNGCICTRACITRKFELKAINAAGKKARTKRIIEHNPFSRKEDRAILERIIKAAFESKKRKPIFLALEEDFEDFNTEDVELIFDALNGDLKDPTSLEYHAQEHPIDWKLLELYWDFFDISGECDDEIWFVAKNVRHLVKGIQNGKIIPKS